MSELGALHSLLRWWRSYRRQLLCLAAGLLLALLAGPCQ